MGIMTLSNFSQRKLERGLDLFGKAEEKMVPRLHYILPQLFAMVHARNKRQPSSPSPRNCKKNGKIVGSEDDPNTQRVISSINGLLRDDSKFSSYSDPGKEATNKRKWQPVDDEQTGVSQTRSSSLFNDDDSDKDDDPALPEERTGEELDGETDNGAPVPLEETVSDHLVSAKPSAMDRIKQLESKVQHYERECILLRKAYKDVSAARSVDESKVTKVKRQVYEQVFKKVKFMITAETTDRVMVYLCSVMNIDKPLQLDWMNTYVHHVRTALNAKRNNVTQDLKKVFRGKLCVCCLMNVLLLYLF